MLKEYKDVIGSLELIPSSGGVFEVTLDGELVFSKKRENRFPEPEEITSRVEARRNGG